MLKALHRQSVGGSSRVSVVLAVAVGGLLVGCVPYQTYQQTKAELEKARDANNDLIKKYNTAVQQLMAKEKAGVPEGEVQALLADNKRLREQLASAKRVTPDFTEKQIRDAGGDVEDGGIGLGEALLFTEGSDRLKPEAFRVLDNIIALLKREYPEEMVVIEGHTDNQPLVKALTLFPDNLTLGYKRAHAVFKYFSDHGVSEPRIIVHSYSCNKPLDPRAVDTKEGRKQNRRVVVRRGGAQI